MKNHVHFLLASTASLHPNARAIVANFSGTDEQRQALRFSLAALPRYSRQPKLTGNRSQRARQLAGFSAMGSFKNR